MIGAGLLIGAAPDGPDNDVIAAMATAAPARMRTVALPRATRIILAKRIPSRIPSGRPAASLELRASPPAVPVA